VTVAALVAACSFAGGYFIQFATMPEDWRAGWKAREGAIWSSYAEVEHRRFRRMPYLVRGKFYGAITCGTCFGWHVAYLVLGLQALLAAQFDERALVGWSTAPVVWGAACGLHTAAFKVACRFDLLKED
jgi:hypothetical protein